MAELRVVYRLLRVSISGDSVGDDWTLHLHTGAGLVRVTTSVRSSGDEDRRERVLGVREVEVGDALEFAADTWWVSATERDRGYSDRAAGLYTPVAIPLEPGIEVWRSLAVAVVEHGPSQLQPRRAELRVDLSARVEPVGDEPAPELDADPLPHDADIPRPTATAGALPDEFTVDLRGIDVDAAVPVIARRKHEVTLTSGGDGPVADALRNFLQHHTGARLPALFTARAVAYELRNADGVPFWIGETSSVGRDNHARAIAAFAAAAPPLGTTSEGFAEHPSLLRHLLEYKHTDELGPAAAAIADVVATFTTEHPEQTTVERGLFVRTALIDEFSGEWTCATFIDPTPLSGPDSRAWMLVWTDAWIE
ncbi:hypothetical protein [Nannocystis radixulma]|uniref:Uncharacterized protein n=1 Tax=Nannocystis radixulma TaxID=2995305 RepID=A0ABT5BDM5_9BACT|nr:hypothetical protein [Nannocystis radixulma]MDC0672162.1 hypothetical protein [Nannocystis radixulma]